MTEKFIGIFHFVSHHRSSICYLQSLALSASSSSCVLPILPWVHRDSWVLSSCRVHFSGYRCTALAQPPRNPEYYPRPMSLCRVRWLTRQPVMLYFVHPKIDISAPWCAPKKTSFGRYYTQIDICNIFWSWSVLCLAANGLPMSTLGENSIAIHFNKSNKTFPQLKTCANVFVFGGIFLKLSVKIRGVLVFE